MCCNTRRHQANFYGQKAWLVTPVFIVKCFKYSCCTVVVNVLNSNPICYYKQYLLNTNEQCIITKHGFEFVNKLSKIIFLLIYIKKIQKTHCQSQYTEYNLLNITFLSMSKLCNYYNACLSHKTIIM